MYSSGKLPEISGNLPEII